MIAVIPAEAGIQKFGSGIMISQIPLSKENETKIFFLV